MKLIVLVTLALVAVTIAAPVEKPAVEIVEYKSETDPDGSYRFYYKTSDGSIREEYGIVKEALDEEGSLKRVVVVNGSYTVVDADGNPETITYAADEAGYRADGKSIPKIPV